MCYSSLFHLAFVYVKIVDIRSEEEKEKNMMIIIMAMNDEREEKTNVFNFQLSELDDIYLFLETDDHEK